MVNIQILYTHAIIIDRKIVKDSDTRLTHVASLENNTRFYEHWPNFPLVQNANKTAHILAILLTLENFEKS